MREIEPYKLHLKAKERMFQLGRLKYADRY